VVGHAQEFTGKWVVEPNPGVSEAKMATVLRYEIYIVPKWSIPSTIVTSVVKAGLPSNIRAIADRAELVPSPPALLSFPCLSDCNPSL
jgi:hypothetical protein